MVRYHYREGVTLEKKKSRWFLIFIGLIVAAVAVYAAAIFLAPQLVTVPFTSLTADLTDNKIKGSRAGQFGDRLFMPQINVDVAIYSGGAADQLKSGVWQRNTASGDPEKGGNFALSGAKFTLDATPQWTRAKSPFYNLGKLKPSDELTLDFHGKRYVYKVEQVAEMSNTDPEQKHDGYRLTLYPTDSKGRRVSGAVVSAVRISPVAQQAAFGN